MVKFKGLYFLVVLCLFSCRQQKTTKETEQKANKNIVEKGSDSILPDKLIIPGKQLGRIKLDQDALPIYKRLGKPDRGDAAMGKALSTWYIQDSTLNGKTYLLSIFTTRKMGVDPVDRVKFVRTTLPKYRSKNKLGVGSSLAQIRKHFAVKKRGVFTKNNHTRTLYDTPDGIAFEIDSLQLCTGILIHPKEVSATGSYIPFYGNLKKEK